MAQPDSPADGSPPPGPLDSALPETVLEHLGRRLRAELRLEADKPAYLGDEMLPARFLSLVRQIERREISSQAGIDAIRREFNLPAED